MTLRAKNEGWHLRDSLMLPANFANHPNWGNPNTSRLNSDFGQISGTRVNMRELQFARKSVF